MAFLYRGEIYDVSTHHSTLTTFGLFAPSVYRRTILLIELPETDDFSPQRHLEVLRAHAPDLRVDVVLADRNVVEERDVLEKAARTLGGTLVLADVAAGDGSPRHDPARLAQAFAQIFVSGHCPRQDSARLP